MARAGDVRELVRSIALGSGLGLVIGGAYLLGSQGLHGKDAFIHVAHAGLLQDTTGDQPSQVAIHTPPKAQYRTVLAAATPASPPALRPSLTWATLAVRGPAVHIATAQPFRLASASVEGSDLECLTQAVFYESRGEPKAGQEAVAQVVLNRVRHPAFPKTVCGVVRQRSVLGCQFSFSCHTLAADPVGSPDWRRARQVASAALNGAVMADVGEATHFQTVRSGAFDGLLKVAQIGAHAFYRFTGRAGSTGMFHQAPEPSSPGITVDAPAAVSDRVHVVLASLSPAPVGQPAYRIAQPSVASGGETASAGAVARAGVAVSVSEKPAMAQAKTSTAIPPAAVDPAKTAPTSAAPTKIDPASLVPAKLDPATTPALARS